MLFRSQYAEKINNQAEKAITLRSLLDFDFSNIIWNDHLAQQNLIIANKKLELKKKIFDNINMINVMIQKDIIDKIKNEFKYRSFFIL